MLKKWLQYVFPFLVLCIVLAPPTPSQVKVGAEVQTWNYDPQSKAVTATIVNVSHKDITGYNISIKETYADGHVNNHELLCDYAGRLVLLEEVKGTADEARIREQFGDGLLHFGESRNELIGVQPGLLNFEAVVDVVAYADQTAETTNSAGLQRLLEGRKASLASTQMANEISTTHDRRFCSRCCDGDG